MTDWQDVNYSSDVVMTSQHKNHNRGKKMSDEYRKYREMIKAIGKVKTLEHYKKEKKDVPKISK